MADCSPAAIAENTGPLCPPVLDRKVAPLPRSHNNEAYDNWRSTSQQSQQDVDGSSGYDVLKSALSGGDAGSPEEPQGKRKRGDSPLFAEYEETVTTKKYRRGESYRPTPPYNPRCYDSRQYNSRPYHSRPYNSHSYHSRPYDSRPYDSRPYDSRPYDCRPYDSRPRDSRPYDPHPYNPASYRPWRR